MSGERTVTAGVIRGITAAVLTGVLLSLVLALLFWVTSLSESTLVYLGNVLLFVSALAGGMVAVRYLGRQGLWLGCLTGAAVFAVDALLVVTGLFPAVPLSLALNLGLSLLGGAVGGIIGIAFS